MPADTVRILNFDNSLTGQKRLLERYQPRIVDLTAIGPSARLWANKKTAATIQAALPAPAQQEITFLGSGDFHHVSSLLVGRFAEPLTLIVFDFHPDWDILPPRLGCGSWVTRSLEHSTVTKAILLGVSSDDIASPAIYTGNLRALENDRLELYPYAHSPTRVMYRHVPKNSSLKLQRSGAWSEITWTELRDKDPETFMSQLLRRCETKKAYVSIDKDCLREDAALTNWEQGRLSLDELLRMLRVIKQEMDIAAVDITGEYSQPVLSGPFKSFCSRMDHPADYTAQGKGADAVTRVNEETNLRVLELLLGR